MSAALASISRMTRAASFPSNLVIESGLVDSTDFHSSHPHGHQPQHLSGRGTTRAEDAQGTPTQSHISPSILACEDYTFMVHGSWLGVKGKGVRVEGFGIFTLGERGQGKRPGLRI